MLKSLKPLLVVRKRAPVGIRRRRRNPTGACVGGKLA
jgi:hypothetical protein